MRKLCVLFAFLTILCASAAAQTGASAGTLNAFGKDGELGACPLKKTDVNVEISGSLSRVNVRQEFENSFTVPIEAVYEFPLSQNGAVDKMTMTIGSRVIKGRIMRREEARKIYENAKNSGQTAALLDQERTNIFTQSVANILPGETIVIEISYVETLKYEDGKYEFVFPMTIGPRYVPGTVSEKDAARITPPIAETRAGHDISIEVALDAGVPVESIKSALHAIQTTNLSPSTALIKLQNETTIPNKDFILRYDVTGGRINDAVLTHRGEKGGFFTMILSPPDNFNVEDVAPKEIVFVLDTSGSMSGFPIEKAKEAMRLSLEGLYPRDTFNLITFAGDTHVLFEKPVPATAENMAAAKEFLQTRSGGGGTEMMKAVKAAFAPSGSSEHIRIVCFMTDGFIGNENEILKEIRQNPQARVFSFGIGNSVNRMLLDGMAKEGNGEVEYVTLADESEKAARRFYERVRTPLLTDISIDWNGMPVADVYPKKIGDLFSAKPVVLNGRFTKAASGSIKLKGNVGGQQFVREIAVSFPEIEARHDVLATLWARKRIAELTSDKLTLSGEKSLKTDESITNLGLEFGLMTEFTSFVAVEERVVNRGGVPVKIEVPVELADGVSADQPFRRLELLTSLSAPPAAGLGSGMGSGSGFGNGGGGALNMSVSSVVEVTDGSSMIDMSSSSLKTVLSRGMMDETGGSAARNGAGNRRSRSENSVTFDLDLKEIAEFRREKLGEKNAGSSVSASAANLPLPEVPDKAPRNETEKIVKVEFAVNESGEVFLAKAVSGSDALRRPAESAMLKARFSAPQFEGERMRMFGTAVYHFGNSKTVKVSVDKIRVEFPETAKRRILLRKRLHFWVYDLVSRLEKGAADTGPNESKFVSNGIADLRLTLDQSRPELVNRLRTAGFAVESQKANEVRGRIAVEKIADLSLIDGVAYVSP